MIDLKEYQRLVDQVTAAKSAADRAAGAYEQALARLKEEFGCTTLKAAEALLEKEEAAARKAEEAYNTELAAFMEAWGDTLDIQD